MNPWIKFAGACAMALTASVCSAQPQELVIGNSVSSAGFPCAPERKEQSFKTEVGEIRSTMLVCSKGDSAYTITVVEYPAQMFDVLSVDEILDSTLDDARSKPHIKIKSSPRTKHQNLPGIRHHLLDQRKPQTETIALAVLADKRLVFTSVVAPPSEALSKTTQDFVNSLKITRR